MINKKYYIPIALLVGLALLLLLLPAKKKDSGIRPEELLDQITNPSRFVSPDDVATRIIEKDPSLVLIDVRSSEEYLAFTLPGAINIPLADLNNAENIETLKQEGLDFILFSNGTLISDQAWILVKRLGIKNLYILEGGLNLWFENFFMTSYPMESQPGSDIELYQFRIGVRQFFTGGEVETAQPNSNESIKLQQKVKKSAAEGGC
jgi:sulfur-carrier protein adenylyltransferase/sulfurtransferase